MNNKLIVFGSARMDAFLELPLDEAQTLCNINDNSCMLELSYSSKIPLNNVEILVGGNGANVAVGARRLGIESVLIAEVGTGVMAEYTVKELEKEIDTTYVTQTEGIKQGFGAVVRYGGERTILSYYSPKPPPFPKDIEGTSWAYLTSTGENFEGYYDHIYEWVSKYNPRLAFNPGGRQISKGIDWLKKFLAVTELLLVNREEAEKIVSTKGTHGKEKELIDAIKNYGPKKIVVTDGMNGTFAFDGKDYWHQGVFPIEATERTGAGDSFSAGAVSALIQGKTVQEALLWGTVNATSVVQLIGPQPGLLDKEGLNEWLERAKNENIPLEQL